MASLAFIDRESPVPAHYQLKQILLERVRDGDWAPASRIPSEAEIQMAYRVSRTTVRQAVLALVQEGFLRRERGVGTFVRPLKLQEDLSHLKGFTEDMEERGLRAGARVVAVGEVQADQQIRASLELPEGALVCRIERVRLADGQPISHELTYWRSDVGALLLQEDLADAPLYRLVEQKYGFNLSGAHETIEAALPSPAQAEALSIRRDTPVLVIHRVTYDGDGRPIECCHNTYRADRYQYSLYLKRRP